MTSRLADAAGGRRREPCREATAPSSPDPGDLIWTAEGGDGGIKPGGVLYGAEGATVGAVRGLLVSRASGLAHFVLVETGGQFDRKRFLLPVWCIDSIDGQLCCPFTEKQFEYGPQWRDGEGGPSRLDRHHAYWTGLTPLPPRPAAEGPQERNEETP